MARCSVVTRSISAVVDVHATVEARPTADAHTVESTEAVFARSTVLTRVRRRTLVHVLRTVLACKYQYISHHFRFN